MMSPLWRWLTPCLASCASLERGRRGAQQGRPRVVDGDDAIGLSLDVHDARLVVLHLRTVVLTVGDDDDGVAAVHEARGGTVDLDIARAALPGDRGRLEAGPVG